MGPGLELSGAPRAMGRGCAGGDSTTAEVKLKEVKANCSSDSLLFGCIFFPLPAPGKREVS